MATYYLVASGNINASAPFATTSGGAGGAGIPGAADTILCDANSGAANLTINASVSIVRLDCQGGTGLFTGTITHNAFTLTITGSGVGTFRLSPGMTYTPASATSVVAFTLTSGTAQITSAGKSLASITMNGPGGTVQMQDNLALNAVSNSTFTLAQGIWDCNNAAGYTFTMGLFAGSAATARTFIGAGTVTCGSNVSAGQSILTLTTVTNLTWTLNNAAFVFNIGSTVPGVVIAFGNQTFNAVTFNCANRCVYQISSFTCSSLNINPGVALQIAVAQSITITGSIPNFNGTALYPIGIVCTATNSTTAINCNVPGGGTCVMNWCTFGGIVVASTTSVIFTATNSIALWGVTTSWYSFQNPMDAVTVPSAIWQDLLSSSDFTTPGSVGALLGAMKNLQYTAPAIGRGTVAAGGTTTSVPTSAFAPSGASANQFAGRVLLFDVATTTAALRGEVATVSASTNAANPTLTVSALTVAPAAGDSFSVL